MRHPLAVGVGAGLTTFGLVAVVVIELVEVDPGAGILGVGLGAVAAIMVVAGVVVSGADAPRHLRWGLTAVAAFGYTVLAVMFVSYSNVVGPGVVTVPRAVLVGAVVAGAVLAGLWWTRREVTPLP